MRILFPFIFCKPFFTLGLALFVSLLISGCSSFQKWAGGIWPTSNSSRSSTYSPASDSISVMAFNVENLFDTVDDPKKEDETFLPLNQKGPRVLSYCSRLAWAHWRLSCEKTNWTEKTMHEKMRRLADVIRQVKSGAGPEILILPEVENKNVLELFRQKYLSGLGYKEGVLFEGPDIRGIDVAILTKLEVLSSQSHRIHLKSAEGEAQKTPRPTRDIIQTDLSLPDGQVLTVLGLHFPSPGNPVDYRIQSIQRLNEIKKSLPPGRLVLAGGDFNITSREEAAHRLYSDQIGNEWTISHEIACKNCRGTYYYHRDKTWSFLDSILFSKDMLPQKSIPEKGSWEVVRESIRIPTESLYQVNRYGSPGKFHGGKSNTGVSDHWPIVAEIRLNGREVTAK